MEKPIPSPSERRTFSEAERHQKRLELQVEYWKKRLDHTLTHTDSSNKHIYVVDGAFLAFVYFAMQTFGINVKGELSPRVVGVVALVTFVLAILNSLHVLLVINQGRWYNQIDEILLKLLGQASPRKDQKWWKWYQGTHSIYAVIHIVIALSLGVGGYYMCEYEKGKIEPIVVKPPKSEPYQAATFSEPVLSKR